jgi:signal transduction histidine kinase/DNA-binding response OmpR family regulator/ABC-type sugar transport system substrate-binding protein
MAHGGKRTRPRIGVLAGWQAYGGTLNTFLNHIFRGILSAADDRECDLLLACGVGSPRDVGLGRPAWPVLLPEADFVPVGPWNVDGLIVVPPLASDSGSHYVGELVADGYPVVFAGAGETGPSVLADNEGGIGQALAHLVEHGHRRIAFIAGHEHRVQGDSGRRLRAFESALRERNLPYEPGLIAYGSHMYGGGRQAVEQILGTGIPFTAILASNDESAIGAMDALKDAGILVPQDVAVVGFDDRMEARAQSPPLTTVHHPTFELGHRAVGLLLEYVKGTADGHRTVKVPTRLVVRESCGCLPGTPVRPESQASTSLVSAHPGRDEPGERTSPGPPADRLHIVQAMAQAVSAEMQRMSAGEAHHLCQRLTEALLSSLEQDNLDVFREMIQQILQRTISLGSDPGIWQVPISLLRDSMPAVLGASARPRVRQQAQDALDQARIAIGESAREQYTRHLIRQADISYWSGQMTARFYTAEQEAEVYRILAQSLPRVGIEHAVVALYEREGEDPVAWSALQPAVEQDDRPRRFPTREFPPQGLFPGDKPLSIALLPLMIQDELRGFVAFDTGNLEICGDIVRQLAAALRGVWLYHEAVEGRRLAEEANRLKSRFLSMVSHELRTPLNLISGLSDMLLREGEETEPGKYRVNWEDLERIYVNAQHLDGLIRDVLDLTLNEAGQLKLTREPLDLAQVLGTASVIGEQLARDKGLSWRAEIPPDLPRVWGDRTRLRQVALNLINNAVKFTMQGEIALTAAVEDGLVTVAVQDTGLGIPEKEQEAIFDEFRQSERTAARGYGGLGLGLAICKRLVEMHGGEIGVRSGGELGAGSTFYFTLPAIEQQVMRSADTISLTQGERVMLLTKGTGAGNSLQDHLTERGFDVEVHTADGTADWLSWLMAEPPAAILLDLGLASEQGWELLRILKDDPATKDIPVLFASVAGDQPTGAIVEVDYLTKPVGLDELSEALLYRGLASREGNEGEAKTVLIVDDEPGVLEMHARIVEAQLPGCQVLRAHNGRDALQIIQQGQPDLVLLDLMMPELDGFGVLEAMHEHETSRNIPVIVLTGQVLTEEDMSRLNRGVTSILGKGLLSVEETLAHINSALSRSRKLGPEAQQIARQAMAFIHAHYTEPISRTDIAFEVGVSERHLARCFRKEMDMTVNTYLNRYRVRQARLLLEVGDKNITEIALEVGFSSSGYFSQVFRQETGVSPSAYQRGRRWGDA